MASLYPCQHISFNCSDGGGNRASKIRQKLATETFMLVQDRSMVTILATSKSLGQMSLSPEKGDTTIVLLLRIGMFTEKPPSIHI